MAYLSCLNNGRFQSNPWNGNLENGLSVIALVTGILIRPLFSKIPFQAMAGYTGMAGLLYGFVISLSHIPINGFKYVVSYYLAGMPFDMMHAAGISVSTSYLPQSCFRCWINYSLGMSAA